MVKTKVDQAAERAHIINETIQDTLRRQEKNDRRFRFWAYTTLIILIAVGVGGIFYQNYIANQSKQHIDCIVKLFSTPLPKGKTARSIENPSTTCNIKFTN